jgi:hypothetical protein
MRFTVNWTADVYDASEDEDRKETGTPFEISADSLDGIVEKAHNAVKEKVVSMHRQKLGTISGIHDGYLESIKGIDNEYSYTSKQGDDEK